MTINEKEQPNNAHWSSPEMSEKRNSTNDSANEEDDREHRLERADKQMREYAQKIQNGGGFSRTTKLTRDRDDPPTKINGYYRTEEVYQRPVDEVDATPPFPMNGDVPAFRKIGMPGVKIMRVERDDERGYESYRYSDSSQYDNVPTRMRGSSPGILKRQRDVSFADPHRSRDCRPSEESEERRRTTRDEIATLAGYFDELRMSTRTASATTQTGFVEGDSVRMTTPATPNDPGYVRHTASNWPRSLSARKSIASPEREV